MNSKDVGSLGEHIAIVELLKLGIEVSRPLGDNSRYDIIIDNDGILLTCQIKSTNSASEDLAEFWMTSSQAHRGSGRKDYSVDCFILVDVKKSLVFLLPNEGKKSVKIRYKIPTSINQYGINMYNDYNLSKDRLNLLL